MNQDELRKKRQFKIKELWAESREQEAQRLAAKSGLNYLDFKKTIPETDALEFLTEEEAKKNGLIPFQKLGKDIRVAVLNPENSDALKIISQWRENGFKVTLYVVSTDGFNYALNQYRNIRQKLSPLSHLLDVNNIPDINFKALTSALNETDPNNITQITGLIVKSAIISNASDIHFEPQPNNTLLRFRIDGVLYDVANLNTDLYHKIRDRLKLLADLKINIQDSPQTGRFSALNKNIKWDIRASSIPGPQGEYLVFRLLNPKQIALSLEDLGLEKNDLKILLEQIQSPNGLILNTGPTGSGKTTTLYALLKRKQSPGLKIVTIEDPIEYKLEGISQTQVDEKNKYDFANGLKSIMRQDPDVILVGEIRDKETAEIAIQASLTGHLVFSTLHTNEASDTISRLVELGIDRKLLPSALKLVIAQRLVRRLCPFCKEKYQPDDKLKEEILKTFAILSPKSKIEIPRSIPYLYRAKGCEKCFYLGYQGQIGIFEEFILSEKIIDGILNGEPINKIREMAIDNGMVPLFHAGLIKAINGLTSLEEVVRVAGDISYIKQLYNELLSRTLLRGLTIDKNDKKIIEAFLNQKEKRRELISPLLNDQKLKIILGGAIKSRATDVHLEPQKEDTIIRYRIDNVLNEIATLDIKNHPSLINQIKELAGADTSISQKPQEGRFVVNDENKSQDIRVSIIPSGYGESVALRLLSGALNIINLEDLGFFKPSLKTIKETLKPTGILLVCGPTSSGKTTTLFSILKDLNKPGIKIITVEDPIEYRLTGVLQTQIDEKNNYRFSDALKLLLRQNPNIMLIGEIRDKETAQLALQAALTGHLILSSLHTNDALSAIPRLRSFGLNNIDLANGLNGIIAQRLIRKLCPKCKRPVNFTEEQKKLILETKKETPKPFDNLLDYDHKKVYEAKGCAYCNFTGYLGQSAIFELIPINENRRKLISEESNYQKIREALKGQYLSLKSSAYIRILDGTTSWQEIERVLGLED